MKLAARLELVGSIVAVAPAAAAVAVPNEVPLAAVPKPTAAPLRWSVSFIDYLSKNAKCILAETHTDM